MIMPAEYRLLECICEKTPHPMLLCYSKARGFFEPITNLDAEPIAGRVLAWQYVRD